MWLQGAPLLPAPLPVCLSPVKPDKGLVLGTAGTQHPCSPTGLTSVPSPGTAPTPNNSQPGIRTPSCPYFPPRSLFPFLLSAQPGGSPLAHLCATRPHAAGGCSEPWGMLRAIRQCPRLGQCPVPCSWSCSVPATPSATVPPCLCPPHPPPAANFGALLPADAAAGGPDGALGDTCLGFVLAPNSHYFTRQPGTYQSHPHGSIWWWGGEKKKKKNNTKIPQQNQPSPGEPSPPPLSLLRAPPPPRSG